MGSGKKAKTNEQFIKELKTIISNIEVLENYTNYKTKILVKCKICDYEWKPTPDQLLNQKSGCPKCANRERYTTESFKTKLKIINPNIEVLGKYVNNKTKILVKCKIDNYEWLPLPDKLLRGHGCSRCHGVEKYNEERFRETLKQIKPTITIIGKYIDYNTRILLKCKIDEYEWKTTPSKIINSKSMGCPCCNKKERYTTESFKEKLIKINPDIELISEFKNMKIKAKFKCKIDEYEWMVSPGSLLRGIGCPRCSKKERYTIESFKEKLRIINDNIELIGEFKTVEIKTKFKCKIDDYEWFTKPDLILYQNCGCPKCNEPKGEREMSKILTNNNIEYITQHKFTGCKNKRPLSFDFYLPKYNLCIEYDGEGHYRPVQFNGINNIKAEKVFLSTQINDNIKNEYCSKNDIDLLRICYKDYQDINKILSKVLGIVI